MRSSNPLRVLACTFAAVLLTSCGGGKKSSSTIPTTTNSEFVFIADLDNSLIDAFALDPTAGTLTSVSGTPFTSDYRPISIAVHPSKDEFYVANSGHSTTCATGGAPGSITSYSYAATGVPTKGTEHCLPASPQQLLISSDGNTVYALLSGGSITTLTVGSTGDVTVSNTYTLAGGANPTHIALTSDNLSLYAADPNGLLSILGVNGATLTEAAGSPISTGSFRPADLACCNGSSLYLVDSNARLLAQATVSTGAAPASFAIAATQPTDQFPNHIAYDSAGKNVLVTNLTTAQLSLFPLDATTGAPQAQKQQIATSTYPTCIFGEPSGKYFFVTNYHANSVSGYSLSSAALASGSSANTGLSPICGAAAHNFK